MAYTIGRFTVDEVQFIQSVPVRVLVGVAGGDLDLNRLAREELANRGYDQGGVWVGFQRAEQVLRQSTGPGGELSSGRSTPDPV